MDLKSIFLNGGGILAILMTVVQIAPIQVNPWSWLAKAFGKAVNGLAKAFGKAVNGDVMTALRCVQDHLDSLEANDKRQDAERERDKALDARRRIIGFGDDCRRGVRHSKEHFDSVFEDIDSYKRYCKDHPEFENDKAVLTIRGIEEIYHKCVLDNDFL